MRGNTHSLGGTTATNTVLLLTILLLKPLPLDTQFIIFLLAYFAIRWVCELTCKLADTDASLDNLPIRNEFGYVMFGLAKKLGVVHRGAPIHAIVPYLKWLGIPSVILLITYLTTFSLTALSVWIIVTSALAGFLSHLILDAYTLTGVYMNKNKWRLVRINHEFIILKSFWVGIFPVFFKKKIHVPYSSKVTGGEYEEYFRDNLYEINKTLYKLCLLVLCFNFTAIYTTIKTFI